MTNRMLHRLESGVFRVAIERFGARIDHTWILEVPGRRTGVPRYTPVKLLDVETERYLVALYGHTDWSRNLSAAGGAARLRHRRRILSVLALELPPDERPRILRAYLSAATRGKTLDILGAGLRDPDDGHLRRIAADHPVFRLTVTGDHAPASSSRTLGVADPGLWAVTSGIAGLFSGAFLILFFAVARPFGGEPSPWAWFGPANDLTSAVQAAALVPVALALRDLMPDRHVQSWTGVGVVAMAAAAVLPVLLVAGVLPFEVQAPLVTFCIAVMYCWLYAISRAGGRRGVLPSSVVKAGAATSLALAAGAVAAASGFLLPAGSAARYVAWGLAGGFGSAAWLGFPVWTLLLRPVVGRQTTGAAERQSPGVGIG